MFFGLFTGTTRTSGSRFTADERRAAGRYVRAAGIQVLRHPSREAAQAALDLIPEPHRSVFFISEHSYV